MSKPLFDRDVNRRLATLEDGVRRIKGRSTAPLPFQVLADGRPFFAGGFDVGGGGREVVYEPPVLPAITNLMLAWAAQFGDMWIDATWNAPTGVGADQIVQYVVQVYEGTAGLREITQGSGATSAHIKPVLPNTEYRIEVFGVSKMGRNGPAVISTITTGRDTTIPAIPTFPVDAVTPGVDALFIRWNANTELDVVNGAGQYRVVASLNSNLSAPVFDGLTSGTFAAISDLDPVPHYVAVAAVDSSGNESALTKPSSNTWTPLQITSEDLALSIGGGNIVRNSGFENDLASWSQLGGSVVVAGRGAFGTKALLLQGTGDYYGYQDLVLSKGIWVLSTWAKAQTVASAPGNSTNRGVGLTHSIVAGTLTGARVVMGGTDDGLGNVVAGKGTFDWKRLALSIEVTSATATVRLWCRRGFGGACTGFAWFDEVQAEQGNTITAYAPRAGELFPGSITRVEIADDSITAPKLVADSVVAGKVAADVIGAREVIAQSITGNEVATRTLVAGNVVLGTLTGNEIQVQSIQGDRLIVNDLDANRIKARTITADRLTLTTSLVVGQTIQSANFSAGSMGWRVDGSGNAEFNNATVRGSTFIGGTINIAGRIVASPTDSAVHLAGNVEIGANYSGTVYSGDTNWGLQVGTGAGLRWTHIRAHLDSSTTEIAWFDSLTQRRILYVRGGDLDVIKPGPAGRFIAAKRNQLGGWAASAIIAENSGFQTGSNGEFGQIAIHVPDFGVASIIKIVGPLGGAVEFRDGGDLNFVPVKASSFLVNSTGESKRNVQSLERNKADGISNLRPVSFERPITHCSLCDGTGRNEDGDCPVCEGTQGSERIPQANSRTYGLLAGEVGAVYPEAVTWIDDKAEAIDLGAIAALLVGKVQQLQTQVRDLASR